MLLGSTSARASCSSDGACGCDEYCYGSCQTDTGDPVPRTGQPCTIGISGTCDVLGICCTSPSPCADIYMGGCAAIGACPASSNTVCDYTVDASLEAQPSSCPAGQVCDGGSCAAGCGIGGTFFPDGSIKAGSSGCQQCKASTSRTAWTNVIGPGTCTGSTVCNPSGVCAAGCAISGAFYGSGAAPRPPAPDSPAIRRTSA